MKLPFAQSIKSISEIIGCDFVGNPDFLVTGINEIHRVEKGDLVFVDNEKYYEKARELALAQDNQMIVHLSDALHARLLGQKKRISESWEYGQRVDPKHLPEPDQKWFATDSPKWKEAAAAKAAEAPKQTETPKANETKDPAIK